MFAHTHKATFQYYHTEKFQNAKEAKVEGGHDSPDSGESSALLKLGLVPNATAAITTAQNSNTNDEKVDNQEPSVKELEEENLNEVALLPKDRPVQKNKKKCWVCKSKLELAQRELGLCKCGKYIYS